MLAAYIREEKKEKSSMVMTLRCIGMKHDNQTRQTVNAGITKRRYEEKRRTSFYRLNGERRDPSRKRAITHKPPGLSWYRRARRADDPGDTYKKRAETMPTPQDTTPAQHGKPPKSVKKKKMESKCHAKIRTLPRQPCTA